MATPEIRFAGFAVNDQGNPIAGSNSWSTVTNVTQEEQKLHFFFEMDGSQVVPAAASTTFGRGTATLNADRTQLLLSFEHDIVSATSAALYVGDIGTNGTKLADFSSGDSGTTLTYTVPNLTRLRELISGKFYVVVNSPSRPSGEIRGHLLLERKPITLGPFPMTGYQENPGTTRFRDTSIMNGNKVVPSVTTDADGTCAGTLNKQETSATFTILHDVDNPTNAALYRAAAGANGAKIIDFPSATTGSSLTWDENSSPALTPSDVADLKSGDIYVLIKSTDEPNGEIRSQIELVDRPITESGSATVVLDANQKTITATITHDIDNPTAAHVYSAARGSNGSIVASFPSGDSGAQLVWNNPTTDEVADLLTEQLYINVHSDEFSSGEIRGQITSRLTSDVSLISSSSKKDTSRILLTQSHNFNLPDGIDSIDNIEISFRVESVSDDIRYIFALFSGGYGDTTILNSVGASGPFFITLSGTPTQLGFPSLTVSEIKAYGFGAAIVAHDHKRRSPNTQIDSVKIQVTFSGSNLTYNESNDVDFAVGSHVLTSGETLARPYFIDLPGDLEGGLVANGSNIVGGGQTAVGTGGILVGPNAEVNPYFEEGTGGAVLGGVATFTYDEVSSGGMVAGGIAPNGTSDFGTGGAVVGGLGDTKFDFVTGEGGATIGGTAKATPYFIDLPGELEGGVKLNSRAKTRYDEFGSGGAIIPAIEGHYFSYPPLFGEGGALSGGEAEVNPYFEVGTGGALTSGNAFHEIGPPFGLFEEGALLGGTAEESVIIFEFPEGGVVADGHTPEESFFTASGGAVLSGLTPPSITIIVGGGILTGGEINVNKVVNPVNGGGAKVSGTFTFAYFAQGTGGVLIDGEIDHPKINLPYTGDGEVTVENPESTADLLFKLFYTGDGEVLVAGNSLIVADYIFNVSGGVDIDGKAVPRADYNFNVVVGDGLIIGSRSDTGIPTVFRAIRKPKGTVGRSLNSDNIFKTEMESLLITTIPPNPELCGLSTKDITLNKCKGAFVPPNLVNRQREHLPTPKQEERNRSSQLAKSGQ